MSDDASVAFGIVAAMFAVPVLVWVLLKVLDK